MMGSIVLNEYELIIEHSNEAVFSLTKDGLIKNWNPGAVFTFKCGAHDIMGLPFLILVPLVNQPEITRLLKSVESGQVVHQYETILLDKNGHQVDSIVTVSPIKNKKGGVIGAVVLAQNVSSLKRLTLQSAIQLRVASILAEADNSHDATQGILKVICEALGFSEGESWVLDPEMNVLRYISNWNPSITSLQLAEISKDLVFHLNEGLPGYIWATKKPYWSNSIDKDAISTRRSKLDNMGINTCFGFPIIFDAQTYGVLLFYGTNLESLDIGFMIIFEVIGKQLGNFIKHRRMEEEILHIAQHDALTGLVNKYYTENALKTILNHAKQHQTKVALLYFDLDNFKHINDSLGHSKGDILLQEIARRVQKSTRDDDVVARFGGDEFAVVLTNITKKDDIDVVAKKILDTVELPFIFDEKQYFITASMGISTYPENGDDLETLFSSADLSMYNAKLSGKNNYQYANEGQENREKTALILNSKLHQAIQNNEFILYYQPIIDIQSNEIVSVEALIRWRLSTGEIVSPDDFIPQLEETNLILKAGLWVLNTACSQMKQWKKTCFHSVSINISVRQLNDQLVPIVKNILNELALSPDKLILEITESMLMQQTYITHDILGALIDIGVNIAIDDFGTGYSSFSYLKNVHIQLLKIDKSFISGLTEDQSSKSIVTAIILMAHALGLKTIAEGVETKEQLDFLKEQACDMYQGYYFSKPLPPDELENLFLG